MKTRVNPVTDCIMYPLIALRCRIVASAGMPRSGSTWLYNATRLLLDSGTEEVCGYWKDEFNPCRFLRSAGPGRVLLLKMHRYSPSLQRSAATVLYSFRDVRDVIASKKRLGGGRFVRLIEQTREYANDIHPKWMAASDYAMRYEDMIAAPEQTVSGLAEALGVRDFDAQSISERINAMRYDSSRNVGPKHNMENLLHRNHVTDGRHGSWKDTIPEHMWPMHERIFKPWLEQNGYSVQPGEQLDNR